MKASRTTSLFVTLFLLASLVVGFSAANAAGNPNCNAVDGDYIVSFKSGVNVDDEIKVTPGRAISAKFKYKSALNGFAASLTAEQVCAFQKRSNVENIELDSAVTAYIDQTSATWGLDRIDQRNLPLNLKYSYTNDGTGVRAYIIDTGILSNNVEFAGRVNTSLGFTAITDNYGTTDCNGHGTHVAGTVGGSTFGVAKNVQLVPIRVLDCGGSGTNSGVIAGIDFVTANRLLPAVANLSLGGGFSSSLNSAIARLVASGVTVAVAAGNSNANACNYSPASEPSAITVGATTSADARASYSNFGSCLDIFAPGSAITSSWSTSTTAINTISGTSMASPHVAGVAALYLSQDGTRTPSQVSSLIRGNGTPNVVSSIGTGSPNILLASNVLSPTTTLSVPSFTALSASSPKRGTARASWSVSNGGSQMIEYVATLSLNGIDQRSSVISTSNTSGSVTFSAVRASSGYTITITARNGVGTTTKTSNNFTVN